MLIHVKYFDWLFISLILDLLCRAIMSAHICLFVFPASFFFSSQQQMIKKLTLEDGRVGFLCSGNTHYLASTPSAARLLSRFEERNLFKIFSYSNWVVIACKVSFWKGGSKSGTKSFQFSYPNRRTKAENFQKTRQSDLWQKWRWWSSNVHIFAAFIQDSVQDSIPDRKHPSPKKRSWSLVSRV